MMLMRFPLKMASVQQVEFNGSIDPIKVISNQGRPYLLAAVDHNAEPRKRLILGVPEFGHIPKHVKLLGHHHFMTGSIEDDRVGADWLFYDRGNVEPQGAWELMERTG